MRFSSTLCWNGDHKVSTTSRPTSFFLRKAERKQTTRLGFGVEEEAPTGVQADRHRGSGLAHISAHGGNHARREGEHQLMSRDYLRNANLHVTNKHLQATITSKRLAQAGGRHSARGRAIGKQVNSGPLGSQGPLVQPNSSDKSNTVLARSRELIGPKLFLVGLCKPFKGMAGTTGLEPAASAVTGQRSNQLNYVPGFCTERRTGGQCRTRTCDLLLVRQAL
jgi:hypothetical protein